LLYVGRFNPAMLYKSLSSGTDFITPLTKLEMDVHSPFVAESLTLILSILIFFSGGFSNYVAEALNNSRWIRIRLQKSRPTNDKSRSADIKSRFKNTKSCFKNINSSSKNIKSCRVNNKSCSTEIKSCLTLYKSYITHEKNTFVK
jgi:hypothetical protein